MASTSEVGHAKNVANFQDLMAFVNGYGANYNPSKTSLKPPQLEALYNQASAGLNGVITKNTAYNNAVNQRMEVFSDMRPLATRLVNALATTNAGEEKVEDAKSFNRKIQGQRASKKVEPLDPNQPVPKTISSSQQSYDQLIQHFEGMISVLDSEPSYTPNETDLKITTLQTKLQELKDANENVSKAYAQVSNARLDRNKILYAKDAGLVDVSADVKKYVKSVFGATSEEFAQVKGIQLVKVK
ncbi:hypothetical protein [Bizionia myxarmorum]|uniref:Uncharacterized protein n=1 Tax=Bizionia myxarmorum TaxID=291186 RepID=A0A5D0QVH8_9FLAO|nr:hypothetical protein [Bizionia myxarmorum]TYB73197.1 hypothetical protein ES674_15235 [Bizionia myxarmorum]